MEVLNDKAAMLSNYEVYQLLLETENQNKVDKSKKRQKHLVNLSTICYEARKHLEKTPCKHQSPEIIEEFLKAMQPFNLTRAEKLQLLNLRPTTLVEIHLIIEDSEERLKTDQEIEELLNVIATKLPDPNEETVVEEKQEDEEEMS
ncbi:DNA-directed RNA polymerase III subunit RPC9-like [Stylophora pistillata]|uniref:DNA-directed RNA polymerase III subunit RPC9 n=1 Tax=Stylophora pistillata TaxID=50429 RepID=A0A2B4RJC7_STYPI|nr:DNA-directed RNA polymerase III subunit RPC9-like [Stylophora pistillata]PFX17286.1 DNA-directed RNA polymerase III subunit RPC9 [Stylophora pistillata]